MDVITARPDFRGWYIDSDTPVPIYCPNSQTQVISGSYARCCSDLSDCTHVTACVDNTLLSNSGSGRFCGTRDRDQCGTVSIFAHSPADTPIITQIHCQLQGRSNIMYRALAEPTDPAVLSSVSSSMGPQLTSGTDDNTWRSTSPLVAATPTTSNPIPTASTTATLHTESPPSRAWIAGAVIGPVAGVALIGLAIFIFWRRRRRTGPVVGTGGEEPIDNRQVRQTPEHTAEAPGSYPEDAKMDNNAVSTSRGGWHYSPQQPVYEMGGNSPAPPSELDGTTVSELQERNWGQDRKY